MSSNRPLAPETAAAQAMHYLDKETGAVVPPIHPTSTFARNENYDLIGGYNYSRYESPTIDLAESVICRLEGGAASRLFGSGLAGMQAVFETVKPGAHVVVPKVMYFGALLWLRRMAAQKAITISQFDQGDIGELRHAVRPGKTELVWIETPANPTFEVIDIAECARIAHDAGAALGVDGTNAPPCTQRPLELGADLSFHSATKYLNGHSDMTGGVVTVPRKTPASRSFTSSANSKARCWARSKPGCWCAECGLCSFASSGSRPTRWRWRRISRGTPRSSA